jgi:hypothetical protein
MEEPAELKTNFEIAPSGVSLSKKMSAAISLCVLIAILVAIDQFLGRRVLVFASGFATLWFGISFVLLTRPPAIPEYHSDRPGGGQRLVMRRDLIPTVSLVERLHLSLTVACGACLLLWITLGGLGR